MTREMYLIAIIERYFTGGQGQHVPALVTLKFESSACDMTNT